MIKSLINLKTPKKSAPLSLKPITEMVDYAVKSDKDKSGDISIREAAIIGIGLAINNISIGIGVGLAEVNIPLTVIFTFIISIITILIGEKIGESLPGKFLGNYAPLISGFLLLILGIIELFI